MVVASGVAPEMMSAAHMSGLIRDGIPIAIKKIDMKLAKKTDDNIVVGLPGLLFKVSLLCSLPQQ